MTDLELLKSLINENYILSFKGLTQESINKMLDSRDGSDFEKDWLRVFSKIEQREKLTPLAKEITDEIETIRQIAYTKVFASTRNAEFASYIADDFEMITKSLILEFNDEWLNALFLSYLQGLFPHTGINPKPNGLELIIETFSIQKLAA